MLRLTRAAEFAPDKFEIWTNLGGIYTYLGDKENALNALEKALFYAPERNRSHITKAIEESRTLPDDLGLPVGLNEAVDLLCEKRWFGKLRPTVKVLSRLGEHPDGGDILILMGRYGPTQTGTKRINAMVPKSMNAETLTLQQAIELLAAQPSKKQKR